MNKLDFITQLTTLLKSRRLKTGMTQEQLAAELGMRRATVVDVENGKNATLHNIARIADFLDIQILSVDKLAELRKTLPEKDKRPRKINARQYPQLLQLLWDRQHDFDINATQPLMITLEEAYGLYEKHARYVEVSQMTAKEQRFFTQLKNTLGNGVYLAA